MAKKRKSAAQRQRAKARQQRAGVATPSVEAGPAPRAKRPPQRRPLARSRRSLSPRGLSWGVVGLVAVAIGAMVVVFATRHGSNSQQEAVSKAAIAKVTHVPASTFGEVGVPSDISSPSVLPAGTPPVESGGKPMVLYVGAEYCPYCAAERWPVVVALGRFGEFSSLGTTTSASNDVFPNTATLSFYGSSYTSPYLAFSSVETETNQPAPGGGYTHLQDLNSQQQQLVTTYNTKQYTGSDGAIPFVMIGNLYAWAGTTLDPGLLKGRSFDEIASQLANPNNGVAKAIDGSANRITAMICRLTGGQPADVCSASYIQQAEAALPKP